MRFLRIKPKIFQRFQEVRTFFVVGQFNFLLSKVVKVKRERRQLLKSLGLRSQQIKIIHQVHSSKAFFVSARKAVNFLREERKKGDALYTDKPGIFLAIRSADCLPILFYNKKIRAVGAVHAGWEGTRKKIVQKAIREVMKKWDTGPQDFYFYFGPAAQVCCYDISTTLKRAKYFKDYEGVLIKREGKTFLDFVKANKIQLKESGIPDSQIEDSGLCTIHNHTYPSHRREGQKRKETLLSLIGRG